MKAGNRVPAAVRKQRAITDRSALLYESSRYVYDHSIARFGRVDQKAAGMLSTSVIVIGVVFGLGSEWVYADLTDRLHTFFSLLSWFFAAGILISAGLAIGSGIAALKISEIETPPLHEGVLDYMLY